MGAGCLGGRLFTSEVRTVLEEEVEEVEEWQKRIVGYGSLRACIPDPRPKIPTRS